MGKGVYVIAVFSLLGCFLVHGQEVQELPEWMQPTVDLEETESYETGTGEISAESTAALEKSYLVHVSNETGFGIVVTVETLDVDSSHDDFLLIMPGSYEEGQHLQSQLLTGTFKQKTFFMPMTKNFYVKFSTTSAKKSFELTYQRYGVPQATLPPIENSPTPPNEQDIVYEVYLEVPATQFQNELKTNFQKAVRIIAEKYCKQENITFDDTKPLDDMVYIQPVYSCSHNWEAPNGCTVVPHSAFVSGEEVQNTRIVLDYQLTADHLQKAWQQFGNDSAVTNLGINVFVTPNAEEAILWYAVGIAVAVGVLLVILIVVFKIRAVLQENRRQSTDSAAILGAEEVELRRKSLLQPSLHQNVPDFWQTKSDVTILTPNTSSIMSAADPSTQLPSQQGNSTEPSSPSEQLSPLSPAVSFGGALHFNFDRSSVEV